MSTTTKGGSSSTSSSNKNPTAATISNTSDSPNLPALPNNDENQTIVPNPRTFPPVSTFHPSPTGTLRELLRTRYPAPNTILLVEGVETGYTSSTKRWRTIRLLLGDGELCIQALLGVGLHRYVDTGDVMVGTYLRLEDFVIESRSLTPGAGGPKGGFGGSGLRRDAVKGKGKGKASGRMVCLIIESMIPVGWNRTLIAMAEKWKEARPPVPEPVEEDRELIELGLEVPQAGMLGVPLVADAKMNSSSSRMREDREKTSEQLAGTDGLDSPGVVPEDKPTSKPATEAPHVNPASDDIDISDDDFEVMPVSQDRRSNTEHQRQPVTTRPVQSHKPEPSRYPDQLRQPETKPAPQPTRGPADEPQPGTSIVVAAASTLTYNPPSLPKPPIKLTTLKAIPSLPYKQNWSVNVVAVISAITPLEPASLPPSFAQRQIRLADPTTPKHVLLTVFLDPQTFEPAVGSVVLLLGVKNHMFDGGSLKKYASDRPKGPGAGDLARVLASAAVVSGDGGAGYGEARHGEGSWWFENPVQFPWCDVAGLQGWWDSQT